MELIATATAKEERLRTSIGTMLIATLATGLRGMSRVNPDDSNASRLRLVRDKRVQLGKAPAMQPSFILDMLVLLASAYLAGLSNVRQVLKHNGRAIGAGLHDAFGKDVIVITMQPKLFLAQLLEMSPGRASAFGLQLSSETEEAPFLLFPSLLSQELTMGSHSRTIETQVNPDNFLSGDNNGFRKGDDNVEGETALTIAQIRTTDLRTNVLSEVSGNRERQCNPPVDGGKATGEGLPLHPVRALVIADTYDLTVRTAHRLEYRDGLALLSGLFNPFGVCLCLLNLPGQGRFDGFRGFDTSRTHQLSRKIRILGTKRIVRPFVQLDSVAAIGGKSHLSNGIKAGGVLLKRCLEAVCLLWGRIELYTYRSIHTQRLSYIPCSCQQKKGEGAFLPIAEARGLLRLYDDRAGNRTCSYERT